MKNRILIAAVASIMLALLSGCSDSTKASGLVTDAFDMPLENVEITLKHNENLSNTVYTNNLGQYAIKLKEKCVVVCGGGNPSLTFVKQDYKTVQTQVEQLASDCVNVSMQVVGDTTQQSTVKPC